MTLTTASLLDAGPVIPVVTLHDAALAVPLARALVAGGIDTVEVTLRTPAALPAIDRIATEVPEIIVGAGTIVSAAQALEARAAGARFLVSPGTTPRLLEALTASELPFLPGIATPSDAVALLERGITHAKLFPAEAVGGVRMVAALAGPFPDLRLCPTGGIDATTAVRYLQAPTVACVGGTWITAGLLPADGHWDLIAARARAAARLRSPGASPPR